MKDRSSSLAAAVLAPIGRDAVLASALLEQAGIEAVVCANFRELCEQISAGIGVALVTEEALTDGRVDAIAHVLKSQPSWSDLPIIVCSFRLESGRSRAARQLQELGNVSFVDRPVQQRSLLAAVRSALRARQRQYASGRAIEARDQFLAMLGHELRNPLSAILFAAELITRRNSQDPLLSKHTATIDRQTRHLNRLVDDLLDVARVTSGKVVLKRETTELSSLVQRSVESLQMMAETHGVELNFRSEGSPVPVDADVIRLEQVVTNLVTNALKYTPRGGKVVTSVGREAAKEGQEGEQALLRVRDTGVGIEPEHLGDIFDLFTQAPTALDRSKGGLGLGLTLVRALVERQGGTVEASSGGVGKGSEFRVRLPLTPMVVDTPVVSTSKTETQSVPCARIVVVEDNEDIRETLTDLLELLGYTVGVAMDGPQGLTRILSEKPDIALVDIGLPGFDGYELARRARCNLGDSVRLIAMTGYGQPEDRVRAFEAGFDDHMTKPLTADSVGKAIERARPRAERPCPAA